MRRPTRRFVAAAATGTVLVATAGLAFAYWSAGGSGNGSGATGTSSPVTAVQTSVVTNLRPGGAPQTLTGNFTNTNAGPVRVTSVVATIGSVVKDVGAVAGV